MKTRQNLMASFAGESQARNRYDIAATYCLQQGLRVLYDVFKYTAAQEQEHAEVFYNFLRPMNGEVINVCADYPINNIADVKELLRMAIDNELDESKNVYARFAIEAREEGHNDIAFAFDAISKVEGIHALRFQHYYKLLCDDNLYKSDHEIVWHCKNCGHQHKGLEAPKICPICHKGQGYFNYYEPYLVRKN